MANLGFIGLGIMGKPMAGHLIKGGHTLFLKSRRSVPEELLAAGGKSCATAKDVAQKADVIFLCVPDTPDVDLVLFGKDGVAEGLAPGKIVVDCSTISAQATQGFAKKIEEKGCTFLDAPISGGETGAKNATLVFMAGGPEASFETVKPYFQLMGKTIVRIGENGAGQICKSANQIVVALNIEAVAEALVFAAKAGADPAKVREALMGGAGASRILELHGERMIKRTFNPGFRIELHQKDLNLVLQNAKALKVALPNTANCQELFNSAAAHGDSLLDHSALVKVLERLANHEVAKG